MADDTTDQSTETDGKDGTDPNQQQTSTDQKPAAGDVDWKARARQWEQRAKANADAATELEELKKAEMSEVDRAKAEAETAKAEAAELRLRAERVEVAHSKGLTAEQAKFLSGKTREELEASADELLAVIGGGKKPADLKQGGQGGPPPDDPDAWLRRLAKR